jgi:hypothetical protein
MISTSVLGVAASSRASTGSSGGSISPIATTTLHGPGSSILPALRPPGLVEIGRGHGMRRDPASGRTINRTYFLALVLWSLVLGLLLLVVLVAGDADGALESARLPISLSRVSASS